MAGMHYDCLIIGAGLSGLAAGIRIAYFEKQVCILERHTTIGGLNSFYRLRRRNYDVGLHAVTNYAAPGTKTGPLSKLLRQLRLRWEDFALRPQTESRVDFPGCRLRFSNDFGLLEAQIAECFPSQIDGFRRLVRMIDEQDLAGPQAGQEAHSSRATTIHSARPAPATARDALNAYLTDPLLVEMLLCPLMFYGSATPNDMEFTQFAIMFRSIYREGFGRPFEGVRRIIKHLVRQYKESGGELRLRAGVRSIVAHRRRAVGVVLDDGTELTADRILSSAGAAETRRLCSGSDHSPSGAAADPPGEITFVESIATLDCQPAEIGHRETIIFYSETPGFTYDNPIEPCDLRSGIICSPNNFQYEQPPSEGAVRITALANNAYWMGLPQTEYVQAKRAWYDRMVGAALAHIPDFRPHVIDVDTFTPRTIRHFTGHIHGCVYGAPRKRWDGTTHLENLFLCGTDQGYLGIVGSMISGISMANRHVLA